MASNTGQVAPRPLTVDEGIIAARLDNDVCKARDGRLPVFHPDGTQIGSITAAGPEMIEAAVNRARWVFENSGWPTAASSERARLLRQFAAAIESDREVLALRDTLDMGRPIGRTYSDVDSAASLLRMAADTVDSESEHVWPDGPGHSAVSRGVPVGVVAAISAWNYPLIVAVTKIAAPLAAGNVVILKPSELAPHSSERLVQLAEQAGLPSGVLSVVTGAGPTGAALAAHPQIALVTFTGSTSTGRAIMANAAATLKRLVLECGGKSPHLVFDDVADLDHVAASIAAGILENSGQLCVAGSRVLVERSIHAPLVERIARELAGREPQNPLDPVTTFGPLVSQRHASRVRAMIHAAEIGGATNRLRERRVDAADAYVSPALLDPAACESAIFQEEVFGPVLCVTPFEGESEALRLANATRYGLVATVWTRDSARAARLARAIEVGCAILRSGDPAECLVPEPPWEPARQSGFGVEAGSGSLRSFQRVAAVLVHRS